MKLIIWVGLLRENVIIHFRERKYEYENSMNLLFAMQRLGGNIGGFDGCSVLLLFIIYII